MVLWVHGHPESSTKIKVCLVIYGIIWDGYNFYVQGWGGGASRTDGNKYISLNLLWLGGSLLVLKGCCTMCTVSFFGCPIYRNVVTQTQ